MNLSFSTKFKDGTSTYFCDKILKGLRKYKYFDRLRYWLFLDILYAFDTRLISITTHHSKIHTIREDKKDRWKAGNDIHFIINPRSKTRFQFAPVLKCKSVQKIEILHYGNLIELIIDESTIFNIRKNHQNNKVYNYDHNVQDLAHNDGFETVQDFFDYFNKDFKGKIIHWTDFKY